MPFFSKRKQGKQKASKYGSGQDGSKSNISQKVKQQETFNGISITPDIQRKDLFKACQRSSNSTAKCVANFPRRSRLSKSIPEVLVDDSILPLFLEFLQKQGAQNVLNFWLAAETFRLSSRDKKLPSYKSRLKLKPNQEFSSNMTIVDTQGDSQHSMPSNLFTLERSGQTNQINVMQQQSPKNLLGLNAFTASSNDNSSNSGKATLETASRKLVNFPGSSEDSCTSSHRKTSIALNPSERTSENNAQNDSNNQNPSYNWSGAPLIHNSTNSNQSSPSHGTLFDNSQTSCSVSPISAGLSTCTDLSVSSVSVFPMSGCSNEKSSETLSNTNSRTDNECSSNSSECSTLFEYELHAGKKIDENRSENELCSDGRLQKEGHATEVCRPQEKSELSRQESRDRKERRRMSNILMDDALSIYRHFISLDASQSLCVDENIRREVESNICTENGVIDPDCFNVAQKFAFDTLQNRYFDDFVRSSYYQKHIMDILTSGKVFLADIMYNDNAMFYFMEFMEQEEKSYLLAFWFAVDSFCQELQSKLDKKAYNPDEALDDAMVLYNKYFSMQASNSLGVSDETRIRIENKICREGGPLPECFEEPMENVLTLLEEVYFPIFLDSSVYMKYLNELFSSVTDGDSDQTITYADDCSSTASGSETSKLMEALVNDVEAHEDPDEIWQRPHFGLSIGRVNEYGIYEPGIEPQPGKEVLKFGQKMKKLVSGDSEKVQQEMAWKVAKMVLEDVKKQQGKLKR